MNSVNTADITTTNRDQCDLFWDTVPDEELLELIHRSRSREAMSQIVERFAPIVVSVIARHLRNPIAREEAFQATFLVLFQSANRIRKKSSLASFLYGVALRVSKRLRSQETQIQKRKAHQENQDMDSFPAQSTIDPFELLAQRLQTSVLDEELSQLPEILRAPLVEHYFAGKSAAEIANSMNLSVSAVEGRIKRGKQRLRSRLAHRGVSLTACLVVIQTQTSGVSAADYQTWITSVLDYGSDPTLFNPSPFVSHPNRNLQKLVQGEMQMKSFNTPAWLYWSGAVCLITIVGLGMLQVSNGGPPSNSNDKNAVLASEEIGSFAQMPLLQMGGMGGMMGGSTAPAITEVVSWKNELSGTPVWLASSNNSDDEDVVRRIEQKLNERISAIAIDAPLSQFVEEISDMIGIDVMLDLKAFEDIALDPQTQVSVKRKSSVKTKDLLKQVLSQYDLVYSIKYDAIVITPPGYGDSEVVRYYDLSYILPNNSSLPQLMESIQESITPETWPPNAGVSTMTTLGSMLIVRAPYETHDGIEEFLRQIAKQSKDNLRTSGIAPTIPPEKAPTVTGLNADEAK